MLSNILRHSLVGPGVAQPPVAAPPVVGPPAPKITPAPPPPLATGVMTRGGVTPPPTGVKQDAPGTAPPGYVGPGQAGTENGTTAATPQTPKAPILPGWQYFTSNEVDKTSTDNPYGQQFLQNIQKYDPSAHYEQVNQYGGSDGGATQTMMKLMFDHSKLPGGDLPGMVDMNKGAFNGMYNDGGEHSYGGHLFNPDAITTDKNGYGQVTDPRNMNLAADHYSAVDKYGPAVIAAIASLGAAAPALMAGNATMGSFSTGLGGSMVNGGLSAARAIGNGGGLSSLAPLALSVGGNALGVPSTYTSAANLGLQYANASRHRNPTGPGG